MLQIVIFRIVFFYLNQQNPEKNEKFEIFASFNKKVIFEATKIVSTTWQTRLNIFLVHGQEKAKLMIMPFEWSRYLI